MCLSLALLQAQILKAQSTSLSPHPQSLPSSSQASKSTVLLEDGKNKRKEKKRKEKKRKEKKRKEKKRKEKKRKEKKRKRQHQQAEKQATSVPRHWNSPSDEEILEDYTRNKHPLSNPLWSLHTKSEETQVKTTLKAAKSNAATLSRAVNAAISQIDCQIPRLPDTLHHQSIYLSDNSKTPMVIDTGASISITPHESDFISKVRPSPLKSINGLQGSCEVVGSGTVEWTVRDVYGSVRRIRTTAYLVPSAQIRLFSPQCYFQEIKGAGSLLMNHRKVILTLADESELEFPFQSNNIPMMLDANAHCAGLGFDVGAEKR
ncbi:unnamed protein product [Cylindrotheca closterium]|uniref:Peptidase A2 domain-containing protein n=1 Tax=Cylindrotheca closterium TaxID=2856 RepID=A0AAD2G5T3_9STRA|nr:unnamed protein product [Cylindrotheca closterium]